MIATQALLQSFRPTACHNRRASRRNEVGFVKELDTITNVTELKGRVRA